ncbi:MAG: hypothetical protein WA030_01005 [Candidatus Microsaccharimonas sp.]
MEFTKTDRLFTPLRPEITAKIQVVAERLADVYDDENAKVMIAELNEELTKHKVVGDIVQISSDEMMWGSYDFEGVFTPLNDETLSQKKTVVGTFLGVNEIEVNGLRTLVYNLQAEIDDQGEHSLVVSAPIETSHIAIELEITAEIETGSEMGRMFKRLTDIEDPAFHDLLKEFMSIAENNEMLNAPILRQIGAVMTTMLAHEGVVNNDERQDALVQILATLVDDEGRFEIEGQEFHIHRGASEHTLFLKSFEATGGVSGVLLVNDYTTDAHGVDEYKNTLQPALIFEDADEKRYYVPLKYITIFDSYFDDCRSSIGRFMSEYPRLFTEVGP